ncbi:DUF294 nucleotidyltransferase-like domain-containing protein [Shouchella shacheensis]|uniref:DUF294 nucleotidyltransferase-like domain-containing protein n=1 Tax=Shouchella shacheensis TaxID=1649580 RepID=UPI0007401D0F|nr:DUF294 nucleotidyltransferase-like domain-containing protein [Shouchella shacheensis]
MREEQSRTKALHEAHERKLSQAFHQALRQIKKERGEIPAPFAFFVMGSAGRMEQMQESDQDHGLVYQGEEARCQRYFLSLGEEIVRRLEREGYARCEGGVMASKNRWCKSKKAWHGQLERWMEDDSFENIRHTLTFFDARTVYGEEELVFELKAEVFSAIRKKNTLMRRFADNTGRLPKGQNLFGQLLVKQAGEHQGTLSVKQQLLFPFVNGLRLIALKEQMVSAPTLERFRALPRKYAEIQAYESTFQELLEKRMEWAERQTTYSEVHNVYPDQLSKSDRQRIKRWMKEGRNLYEVIDQVIKAGESR